MKDKLLKFAPLIFLVMIIWCLLLSLFIQKSDGVQGYSQKPPFIFNPDDIAVNQSGIYLLDDFNNTICAYDHMGNFLYMISFDEGSGLDYVYVNDSENFCRIRVRGNVLYVFDANGTQISKSTLKNGLPKQGYRTFAEMGDVQVELKNSLFYPSHVIVSHVNQEPTTFTVQNMNWHLLKTGSAILLIFILLLGLIIGIRVIRKHKIQTDSGKDKFSI